MRDDFPGWDEAERQRMEDQCRREDEQHQARVGNKINWNDPREGEGPEAYDPGPPRRRNGNSDIGSNKSAWKEIRENAGNGEGDFEEHITPPTELPPLTLAEWFARDLPEPDFILGDWLSTTSRTELCAPSGLGKTNFVIALGMRIAATGQGFLHWRGRRAARVLYVDGEMSRRLLKQRLADEVTRLGIQPEMFFAFSHEDVEGSKPLNTPEGQKAILDLIEKIGGIDFVIFDSVMCLLIGSMSEELPWAQTMPLVRDLTRRKIGQPWVQGEARPNRRDCSGAQDDQRG